MGPKKTCQISTITLLRQGNETRITLAMED